MTAMLVKTLSLNKLQILVWNACTYCRGM